MCYLVRQQQASAESVLPPLPAGTQPPRRWVGAGALLVAGLALAAWLVPTATPPAAAVQPQAAAVTAPVASAEPVAGGLQQVRATGAAERNALPVDDDVPSAPLASKAGYGGCHHGL